MQLHETVKKIYDKIIKLCHVEVLTDTGWAEVMSVNISKKKEVLCLTVGKNSIICTPDHILIQENGEEIFAKDCLNKIIKCIDGNFIVSKLEKCKLPIDVYDLSLKNDSNHLYYTNNILSHNCVIADEFSFVPNNISSKVFESIYPVISSSKNSQFIIVSTPNGADPKNLYYEIWQKANSKSADKNVEGWKPFRFDWWDVPGRDEQWKENTIASIGQTRFDQEFGNVFLTSSSLIKLIPEEITEKYRIKLSELTVSDKEFVKGKEQLIMSEKQDKMYKFKMWHEFQPNHTYLGSGDAAEGIGSDDSVLYIWDVTDLSNIIMCAKFDSNQVTPIEFAFITDRILKLYNKPYYICEKNGIGSGYLDALRITYGYPNIVTEGKNNEIGVYSHVQVKAKACIWAREMMTTQGFGWTIYDKDLLNDFSNFVKKDTKGVHIVYQGLSPAHDDHIMAWIWACYILQPDIVERYFICVKQFVSQLEKIYPLLLQPLSEYKFEDIDQISKDPLYQDFLEFKELVNRSVSTQISIEKQQERILKNNNKFDIYFGDLDDGPSWNVNTPTNNSNVNINLQPNIQQPNIFII